MVGEITENNMDMGTLTGDQFNQQQISRQQKMAEMLLQQGMQQPQGQMVSGQYVAPSITQNLAGLANIYLGQRGIEKAEKAQIDLADRLRRQTAQDIQAYGQAARGTPEQTVYGAGMEGPTMDVTPAVAPNPDKALGILLGSRSPQSQALAQALLADQAKTLVLPEGGTAIRGSLGGAGGQTITGGEKVSPEIRTAAQMLGITGNPSTFTPQQTKAVADQVTANKRSGATNVNVNTANKFAGGFADKASGGAYNMYEAALSAPRQIENAKRTIELVNSGALTGPTADVALAAAKIFNVAGANNKDTISKTEQLFSNRGKAMLGSIKQSGLAGSQGLTEGERKFLTQAEGGTITLNAETLKAMAGLEIKMAVDNQKRWNTQAGKMDKEILNATGAGPVEVYTGIGTVDQSIVDKF
jgi:hypothetical protein